MSESVDEWFNFVEDYYSKSTVPLSWALIGGGEVTGLRTPGSPLGMTTLSKREWKKIIVGNFVPGRNLPGEEATMKGGEE